MYETTSLTDNPHVAPSTVEPFTIEELAREDAALDRQLSEPLWYPVFENWARAGTVGEDEWRRYRAAYDAATNRTLPITEQTLE